MKIVSVATKKGGVGKSTLAGNICVGLAHRGEKVILLDLDSQLTCMKWGSRRTMATIAPKISCASFAFDSKESPKQFSQILEGMRKSGDYDYCVIDVGGRDTKALRSVMVASDIIIAPCLPSINDVESLDDFSQIVDELRAFKPDILVYAVINRANTGLSFASEIYLATQSINDMNNIEGPLGPITDRPSIRSAWRAGQGVYDLTTEAGQKARTEFDRVVDKL